MVTDRGPARPSLRRRGRDFALGTPDCNRHRPHNAEGPKGPPPAQLHTVPGIQFAHQTSAPGAYTLRVLPVQVQGYSLPAVHTVAPPPTTSQVPVTTSPLV